MSEIPPSPRGNSPALHPLLFELLRKVQQAERTATGDRRRPTFRLMREILCASVRSGVPSSLLAECLGTSNQSVRDRAQGVDGTMDAGLIKRLTDLDPGQLDRASGGELTRHRAAGGEETTYRTTDVIRALLHTPIESTTS